MMGVESIPSPEMNAASIKRRSLSVLKRFLAACSENNIQCFAYYGTLLGAVRHGGMIPWDDDIDFAALRSDYKKLHLVNWSSYGLKLCSFKTRGYDLSFIKISDVHTFAYSQLLGRLPFGVSIDVFPLDVVAKNNVIFLLERKIVRAFVRVKSVLRGPFFCKKDFRPICNASDFICRILLFVLDIFVRFRLGWANNYGCKVEPYCGRERILITEIYPLAKLKYEGLELPAPKNFHVVLRQIYGDYMTPPPENKRVSTHDVKYFSCPEDAES